MFTYIKTIFKNPKEIYTGRNMKRSHYFSLILFTALALTFFSLFELLPVAKDFSTDYDEIKASIPDFELVDSQLESEQDSYVYQTDSIVFYFDAENKINTDTIQKNMNFQNAPISIGLLKNKIYFNALENEYSISYSNINNLTGENMLDLLNSFNKFTVNMYIMFIIILYLLNLFIYVSQLIPITLFANVISLFKKTDLQFFQNAKISLLATILPFVLMYAINALKINVFYEFEILFISSILLFYLSISEFKNRRSKQLKDK